MATNTTESGTTIAGKSDTASSIKIPKPDVRQYNPLGNLSSYTYNLTLYMITPDAYNRFVSSGRKDINALKTAQSAAGDISANKNSGAYIIAQSAGVNTTTETRAPGFKYDFYIDNLKLSAAINGKATGTAANITSITFDVIEPYGFSFLTLLKVARDSILQDSSLSNVKAFALDIPSYRQFFILGIRFYGYDKDGNIATTAQFAAPDAVNSDAKTGSGDTALFERFYDISISNITFKLTGRSTVYNITANIASEFYAMSNRFGRTNKDIKIKASSVYNALIGDSDTELGLLTSLNRQQKKMMEDKQIEIANEYDIKFIGNIEDLKNATLVLDSDKDKLRSAMITSLTKESTDALSIQAVPNLKIREITFKTDTAILQAISLIIAQSSFLYNAQKIVYLADPSVAPGPEDEQKPDKKGIRIRWYNIGANVEVKGYDTKRTDWAYKITFVMQPYETPWFETPLSNPGIPYYGPAKRYEYWYTGKNTEIIRYEQQFNNLYYTVTLNPDPDPNNPVNKTKPKNVPGEPGRRTNMPRTGVTGEGLESQNSYITSLYDPAAWAQSKVLIMGDPDFLVKTTPNGNVEEIYNPFYDSDGFTLNPNGGQVFIEIDFKEPSDYNDSGYLTINESLTMMPIPEGLDVKGVSFLVLIVTSMFKGGKFEQELETVLNNFGGMISQKKNESSTAQRTDATNTFSNTSQQAVGLKPDTATNNTTPPLATAPAQTSIINSPNDDAGTYPY